MDHTEFDLTLLDLDLSDKDPTLLFASGGNKNRYKGTKVPIHIDVARELVDICEQSLTRMRTLIPQEYDPDSSDEPDSFIYVPTTELLDPSLINTLSEGPSADTLDLEETLKSQFCYAVVFGRGDDPEAIFIKKSNPVRVPKSQWYAKFAGDNSLSKVDRPEITFYEYFDAIVFPGEFVVCWTIKAFNELFKTEDIVLKLTEDWISAGLAVAPGLVTTQISDLVTQARGNARIRNKWHVASRREPLDVEGQEKFIRAAEIASADGIIEVVDGKVSVTPQNIDAYFGLINEDDFTGSITNTRYRAQSKKKLR